MPVRNYVRTHSAFLSVLAFAILAGVTAASLRGWQAAPANYSGISVEASPQLFATMCALDAAGFGADESTLAELPMRLALRADLLKMQGPATSALRQFYRDHALSGPGETLSRYITFALVTGPPPQFQYLFDNDLLPPDVLSIQDFQPILADFYQEAHLDRRWTEVEPEYDRIAARYDAPVRQIVTLSNAYLRQVVGPANGRAFTVYVEPLVGNRTNFRNFGNHYAIVIGTGSAVPTDDLRHAYLHFMLDPLPLRYRQNVERMRVLLNIAARAPRLPTEYQTDFPALADECLIKAVELRLRHPSPEQLEAELTADDRSGFVLVRPLVAQLKKFEKAAPAMSYYFPDLIAGIDVQAEQKRLQSVTFAPATAAIKTDAAVVTSQESDMDQWLAEGDRDIALQDAAGAQAAFAKVLRADPDQPRAIYGLAIASVLAGNADRAKALFESLVTARASDTSNTDAGDVTILAWSHVYLGRIHDLESDRDLALSEYRAALAVDGAPEAARVAAQSGLDKAYEAPASANKNGPEKP